MRSKLRLAECEKKGAMISMAIAAAGNYWGVHFPTTASGILSGLFPPSPPLPTSPHNLPQPQPSSLIIIHPRIKFPLTAWQSLNPSCTMLMVNILTVMNDLHTLSMMNTFFGEYWTVKNNTTNAVLTDSLNLAVMNTSLTTSLSEWLGSLTSQLLFGPSVW